MCKSIFTALTVVILSAAGPVAARAQAPNPQAQADQMFRSLDADGDGRITLAEGGPQSRAIREQIFSMAGKGPNDSLTRAEFQQVVDRFRAGNGGGRPQLGVASPAVAPGNNAPRSNTPPRVTPSGTGRRAPASTGPRTASSGTRPGGQPQNIDLSTPQVWRGWIVQGRGENANENQMEIELTISGDQIRGRQVGGRNPGAAAGGGDTSAPGGLGTGTFVLDGQAGTLDVTQTEGRNAGKHYPGIFRVEGDTLRWCVSNTERRRPDQLATVGASSYLMVLRRQSTTSSR